ncbi:MAG: hypothetical protein U0943_13235, partial [Brevundimonas sp.]|nr:hypothetical protein [Brevundimonas sp.]
KLALKAWGDASRFAGSKDRAWVSGLVLDVLRHRRSLGWRMGDDGPRAAVLCAMHVFWNWPVERIAEAAADTPHGPGALTEAERAATQARDDYDLVAGMLTDAREGAGVRLAQAVMEELGPLKLDRARFRVALDPVTDGRRGPLGMETVRFEIATNAGTAFGPLDAIASGGELARFALAMKAALAGREGLRQPVMIFDEVDQGVGGAVAEAVGRRLQRLAEGAQVLVVTHSPQVAARGHAHWKVRKADADGRTATSLDALSPEARQEEIARMLSGAVITDEARAAAGTLMA